MLTTLLAQNGITNPAVPEFGQGPGDATLGLLIATLFRTAVVVGGLALLLFIAWGGLAWITAGGDKGKVEEARSRITNGIVGMAILVATVAIAAFLSPIFGINLLNPTLPASTNP